MTGPTHTADIRPEHRVEVSQASQYLLAALDCDEWHVACRHDQLQVIQLSRQGRQKYAVRFECTAPVEKGIYHGSKAWLLSIQPLEPNDRLPAAKLAEIKAGLLKLE